MSGKKDKIVVPLKIAGRSYAEKGSVSDIILYVLASAIKYGKKIKQ